MMGTLPSSIRSEFFNDNEVKVMRLFQFTGIDVIYIYNCLDTCKVISVAVGINNTCYGSEPQRFVNQS